MGNYLLGWDIGTSSLKVVILTVDGTYMGSAQKRVKVMRPFLGAAELDPEHLWYTLVSATLQLLRDTGIPPQEIASIGVSSLCPALVLFNASRELLYPPVIVLDSRSRQESDELTQEIGADAFFAVSGNRIIPGSSTLPLLRWFRKHRPDIYHAADTMGYLPTWLGYVLTGNIALDYSSASYSGLFCTRGIREGKAWSPEMLKLTRTDPAILPQLRYGSDKLGELVNTELIGYGFRQGIPIATGGADTACSALTLGVFSDSEQFLTLGTSGVLCAASSSSNFDDRCMNRCHVSGDTWLMNGAMSNTGLAVSWIRSILFPDGDPDRDITGVPGGTGESGSIKIYAKMDSMARSVKPGAGGVVFLPYLNGERTPVWDSEAAGIMYGLKSETSRSEIVRAVLESAGYGIRQILGIIEPLTVPIDQLPVIGGGASSGVWLQILADITGKLLYTISVPDTAATGAALLGGIAAGIYRDEREAASVIVKKPAEYFEPDIRNAGIYQKPFETYSALSEWKMGGRQVSDSSS